MAARRIGQYLPDWIKIATKVPEEARPQLNAIRTTYENIKTRYVISSACSVWRAGLRAHIVED